MRDCGQVPMGMVSHDGLFIRNNVEAMRGMRLEWGWKRFSRWVYSGECARREKQKEK